MARISRGGGLYVGGGDYKWGGGYKWGGVYEARELFSSNSSGLVMQLHGKGLCCVPLAALLYFCEFLMCAGMCVANGVCHDVLCAAAHRGHCTPYCSV